MNLSLSPAQLSCDFNAVCAIFGGVGGANHECLPAHLENSCDNADKVAMEIRPALCVGRDEDLRFRPSAAAYLLKQISLLSPVNCSAGAINLLKMYVIYSMHNHFWLLRRED